MRGAGPGQADLQRRRGAGRQPAQHRRGGQRVWEPGQASGRRIRRRQQTPGRFARHQRGGAQAGHEAAEPDNGLQGVQPARQHRCHRSFGAERQHQPVHDQARSQGAQRHQADGIQRAPQPARRHARRAQVGDQAQQRMGEDQHQGRADRQDQPALGGHRVPQRDQRLPEGPHPGQVARPLAGESGPEARLQRGGHALAQPRAELHPAVLLGAGDRLPGLHRGEPGQLDLRVGAGDLTGQLGPLGGQLGRFLRTGRRVAQLRQARPGIGQPRLQRRRRLLGARLHRQRLLAELLQVGLVVQPLVLLPQQRGQVLARGLQHLVGIDRRGRRLLRPGRRRHRQQAHHSCREQPRPPSGPYRHPDPSHQRRCRPQGNRLARSGRAPPDFGHWFRPGARLACGLL